MWELAPYRVRLLVAVSPNARFTLRQEELLAELTERVSTLVGAPWDLSAEFAPPELQREMISAVEAVTLERLPNDALDFDKVILLAICATDDGYRVAAREFDVRTRLWGSVVSRPVWQLGKLREVALSTLFEAFAPLAKIAHVKGPQVRLRLKAAGLPSRNSRLMQLDPGTIFLPVIRYNAREGTPQRISVLPWTFLIVQEPGEEQLAPGELSCRVYSGLQSPLSGRRRGRVEPLALTVIVPQRKSTLILQSRAKAQETVEALAGYDVYSHPPDSKSTVLLGRTDRQGRITVPPASNPLRVLLVRHGGKPLARLPVVPGLEPVLLAEIPNDDQRLEAEGFINGLQEELVDLVTYREVLSARTRAKIEEGELDEAEKLIERIGALKTLAEFTHLLDEKKKELAAEQRKMLAAPDQNVQKQIDALFDDTRELLKTHVGGEETEELSQQLRKARRGGT